MNMSRWIIDPRYAGNKSRDRLRGGRADDMPDSAFDPHELRRGTAVEMEHTSRRKLAREIAKDHLVEDPAYYEKLATIDPHHNPEVRDNWAEGSSVASVLVPRDRYSLAQARRWVTSHGYHDRGVDETENYYRFRQEVPGHFKTLRTKELGESGIKIVFGPPRRNPDLAPSVGTATHRQYQTFHGTDPDVYTEGTFWVPGELVLLGYGVDIGYGIADPRSKKSGWYIHDFGPDVLVYRRAKPAEEPDVVKRNFPKEIVLLGHGLGFTYQDANGKPHEVKQGRTKKLCVTPDRRTLVIVGPRGVEYLLTGGSMCVKDWIYN